MQKQLSYKISLYCSIALSIAILCAIVAKQLGWFGIQREFTSGNQSYLEQQRHLTGGSLQVIQGKILIGPYRDLLDQWFSFLGQPTALSFWLYNFTLEEGKRFFQEIAINGTRIRGIIESNQYAQDGSQFINLQDSFADNDNVRVVSDGRLGVEFQHAKTFLTDSGFIIQTANMTYSSFHKNREFFFLGTDTGVLRSLQELFANDWAGLPTKSDALHPNLLVCPTNCRLRIETLLQSAQHSITMYQQYIADDRIQKILQEKKKAGIDIHIILGDQGDKKSDNRDKPFTDSMGDAIRFQANPYVHAKIILVDNQFMVLGSMNMSDTSLDKNREIGILLLDPQQITQFQRMFDKDWNKFKQVDKK